MNARRIAHRLAPFLAALCVASAKPARADDPASAASYEAWARYYERWDARTGAVHASLARDTPGVLAMPAFMRYATVTPPVWMKPAQPPLVTLPRPVSIPDPPADPSPTRPGPCSDALLGTRQDDRPDCPPPKKSEGLHRELWFVTVELFAVQTASIGIFAALPSDVSGFTHPSVANIAKYASMGPHFDNDRWGFNYIGHPLAGSEYYLLARNRKANWWQALLYAAAWSAFWEYVTEGMYERASIQDLIVTPVGGAVLGELRYQLRRDLLDPHTGALPPWPLRLLVIVLDPIEAIAEAVPLKL